jgi:branched-subunit amino acid ABC-type transport system permease component
LGITVLAIYQFLIGAYWLVFSLVLLSILSDTTPSEHIKNFLILILAAVFLVLGVLSFLLSRGYIKGLERARHRGRTVATLSLILVILALAQVVPPKLEPQNPAWTLIFNLAVVVYLGRPRVKAYFKSHNHS